MYPLVNKQREIEWFEGWEDHEVKTAIIPIAKALIDLYENTGDEKYFEVLKGVISNPGTLIITDVGYELQTYFKDVQARVRWESPDLPDEEKMKQAKEAGYSIAYAMCFMSM